MRSKTLKHSSDARGYLLKTFHGDLEGLHTVCWIFSFIADVIPVLYFVSLFLNFCSGFDAPFCLVNITN